MNNFLWCKCGEKWQPIAAIVLRVAVGAIFVAHGLLKVADVSLFAGFLESLNVPMAGALAMFVAWFEVLGGGALILGLFTHWVSKIFAFIMLVALFLVHWQNGFFITNNGYEFVLLLFVASVSPMITGPGKWSADDMLFKNK